MVLNNTCKILILLTAVLCCWQCSIDPKSNVSIKEDVEEKPNSLPLIEISLADLEEFEVQSENWQIVGDVYADFQQEGII